MIFTGSRYKLHTKRLIISGRIVGCPIALWDGVLHVEGLLLLVEKIQIVGNHNWFRMMKPDIHVRRPSFRKYRNHMNIQRTRLNIRPLFRSEIAGQNWSCQQSELRPLLKVFTLISDGLTRYFPQSHPLKRRNSKPADDSSD